MTPQDISAARPEDQREVIWSMWDMLTWNEDGIKGSPRRAFKVTPRRKKFRAMMDAQAYLDAAMMMLPDGWIVITLSEIKGDGMPLCVLGRPEDAALVEEVADHTMAMALCAAILQTQSKGHEHE